jgi:alginate O-acetyltransferase complex protein AlgI
MFSKNQVFSQVVAWSPILLAPTAAFFMTPEAWPRWVFMWVFAFAIYASCKWLTWWTTPAVDVSPWRHIGYLLFWPGLDAPTFLHSHGKAPDIGAWLFAVCKFVLGIALVGATALLPREQELLRGWVGMAGIAFVLHFGIFDLLSVAWRAGGVDARPLMHWPILATSVSEYWGQRWNAAFRDLTHRFLFRPLTPRLGAKGALIAVFIFSGIVHDLVVSLPAQDGYGGPTIFFVIQAAAVFIERTSFGQRLGLGSGWRGWAFACCVLLGPAWLLFHSPFLRNVVLPFLDAITFAQ